MRSNLEDNLAFDLNLQSGRLGTVEKTLVENLVLVAEEALLHFYDPGGANRTITLPMEEAGRFFFLFNVGATNTLSVRTQAAVEVAMLFPNQSVQFYCKEGQWHSFGHVFGVSGPLHRSGVVPDPGAVAHTGEELLYFREDGWVALGSIAGTNFFKFFTDGITSLIPAGADTLRFRSSDGTVGIVSTLNEAVFGDNFNLSVIEGSVDHDALLNFIGDKHVAHSGVAIGTAANSGLSGGGTIASSRDLALDIGNLVADTPVLGDSFSFFDLSGIDTNKSTFTILNGILDHNALLNYSANRHIDHSVVSISAGTGLTGGGDIGSSRTLSFDFNSLNADTVAVGDFIPFYDLSGADHNKISLANLNASLDHNVLSNYVADQHVAHGGVTLTAGSGLTGGGTIAANRTFDVGAGRGIGINADSVDRSALVNLQTTTSYTYLNGDGGKLVSHSNAATIAGTLPQAGAGSEFVAGWFMDVANRGVGTLTITPTTSTINGAATLVLTTGQGARIFSDGTNYFVQGGITGAPAIKYFSADKGGTDQTGILPATWTKISFTTEVSDVGGLYDATNSRWTPDVGPFILLVGAYVNVNVVDQAQALLSVYANGAEAQRIFVGTASGAANHGLYGVYFGVGNGSTYYEMWVNIAGAGNKTIAGGSVTTYFKGTML